MFAPKVAKLQTKATDNSTNKLAPQHSMLVARPFGGGLVEQAHMLQRSIGNQATLRLLAQPTSSLTGNQPSRDHEQEADRENATAQVRGVAWDFSKISVFPPDRPNRPQESSPFSRSPLPAIIQRKLVVGPANDPLEHEADRIADQVMRIPSPEVSTAAPPQVSRNCAACDEEEAKTLQPKSVQRMCVKCEEQEKKDGKGGAPGEEIDGHTAAAIQALRGQGASLPRSERSFFEPRFGQDFSSVRVHTDSRAADLAHSLGARAFTVGQDIVFGSGEYAPGSPEGRQILAHELAHTVQQGTTANRIQRLTISQYSLTKGTCGERNVQWVFSLDKPAPADGYIVQHIQRGALISKCPNVALGPPNVDLSFWEAWKLKKGETVDWTTTRDKWTDGNTRPPNPGTGGMDFANGEVKFFKQSITGDLGDFGAPSSDPKSAWGPGKVTASGALPSTGSEPSWWSGAPNEGPAKRSVSADWHCCDADPKKHSYNLTATPTP